MSGGGERRRKDELLSRKLTEFLNELVRQHSPPGTRWLLVAYAPGTETFASSGSTVADIYEIGPQIGAACLDDSGSRRGLN